MVVAKAYVDQLERSQALPEKRIADLRKAIRAAEKSKMSESKVAKLQGMSPGLEKMAGMASSPADAKRLHALAGVLEHPVA
jgi:hypothetical protein